MLGSSSAQNLSNYYLAWNANFIGTNLNTSQWGYLPSGPSTGLDTDYVINNAVSVANNNLAITTYSQGGVDYVGQISTENTLLEKYGYYQATISFSNSPGQWSAFWLMSPLLGSVTAPANPANTGVETDIVEHRAFDGRNTSISNVVDEALHWNGYGAYEQSLVNYYTNADLTTGYNTYGVLWTPTNYTFYIDGVVLYTSTTAVSQIAEYIILSSEVSSNSWAGTAPANGYGSLATSTTKMLVSNVCYYAPSTTKIWAGGANSAWTNAANWVSGVAPAATDDISFGVNSTNQLNTTLGTNLSINSLTVLNPSGPVSIGSNTLTIGAGGIDMSEAAANLTINATVALGVTQRWLIGTSGGTLTLNGALQTDGNFITVTNLGMATVMVNGAISGTGGLIGSGPGIVYLTGSNSYTGGTTLQGGTVSIGSNTNIGGAASAITFNGGLLQITGTAITNLATHNINWTAFNGGLDINSVSNIFTISQNISGAGGFIKAGIGTLVLSGTNTYSNGTTVNAGLLIFGATNAVPAGGGTVTNNAVVAFNFSGIQSPLNLLAGTSAGTVALNASNLNNTINFNTAGLSNLFLGALGTLTNNLNNFTPYINHGSNGSNVWQLGGGGGTMVITNVITGSDGVIIGGNAGTGLYSVVQFSGSNSYSGPTLVSGTTILKVTGNTGLGSSSVTLSNGCLQLSNVGIANALCISGNPGANVANYATLSVVGGGASTLSGLVTLADSYASVKVQNNSGTTLTISGGIMGSNGNFSIGLYDDEAAGGSSVTLTNTPINLGSGTLSAHGLNVNVASNVVGALVFDYGLGAVKLGVSDAFLGAPTLLLGNSAGANTLNLNGYSLMVSSLSNDAYQAAGNMVTSTNAAIFTVSNCSGSTFGGSLTGAGLALTKAGTATLNLTGTNTYGGATTINGGTLIITSIHGVTNSAITVSMGTLLLGATNAIGANTLSMSSGGALGPTYALDQNFVNWATNKLGGAPGVFALGANSSSNLNFSAVAFSNTFLGGAGLTSELFSGTVTWNTNNVQLGGGAGTLVYTNSVGSGTNLVIGPVNGNGASAVVLLATNNQIYSLLQSGTLMITNDLALGVAPGGFTATNITLNGGMLDATSNNVALNANRGITLGTNGGGLAADSGMTLYVPGVITGSVLTVEGLGTVVLSGVNTYTGGTLVAGGTLSVTNNAALGAASGGLTFTNGGTMQVSGSFTNNNRALILQAGGGVISVDAGQTYTITNSISGAGSLTECGAGTQFLSGANTYLGGTTLNAGVLKIGGNGTLGATNGAVTVNGSGAMLDLGGTIQTNGVVNLGDGTIQNGTLKSSAYSLTNGTIIAVLADGLDGPTELTTAGAGTVILANTNTYSGGTLIAGGTLNVTNNAALGAAGGSLTFSNGGLLEVSGTWTNPNRVVTLQLGGGGVNVDSNKTLTITNSITGSGGLIKSGNGTLVLAASNSYTGGTLVQGLWPIYTNGNAQVQISNPNALGTGGIVLSNGGALAISGGITLANTLTLYGGDQETAYGGALLSTGTNVWGGAIAVYNSDTRITVSSGSLRITNGITGTSDVNLYEVGHGTLTVDTAPITVPGKIVYFSNGTNNLNVGGNAFGTADIWEGGVLNLGASNALPTNVALVVGLWAEAGLLNLNGHNQTVGSLASGSNAPYAAEIIINTGALATFTANQSSNTAYYGVIGGNLALALTGSGTLTLGASNTYSGGTTISNGTLALTGSGSLGSGNIIVASGAMLNASGRSSTFALGGGQTLTNFGSVTGGLDITSGALLTGGGFYSGAVTNQSGGTLTPGSGGDTNYFNSLTLAGGSTNTFYVGSAANHDMSVVSNGLAYTGSGQPLLTLNLQNYTQSANATGAVIMLYQNLGTNAFDGTNDYFTLSDGGPNNGMKLKNGMAFEAVGGSSATNDFTISYNYQANGTAGGGNSIVLTVIPEPTNALLLLVAGAACYLRHRVRRSTWRRDA